MGFDIGGLLGGISGVVGLLGGGKKASQADKMAGKLTAQQLEMLKNIQPLLAQMQGAASQGINPSIQTALRANQAAMSYDPAKQTEDLTRAYDSNARESVNRDLGAVTANSAAKGFTAGTGDSNTGGLISDTLSRRAGARAEYVGGLKAAETGNLQNMLAQGQNATQSAFGAFNPIPAATGVSSALQGPINRFDNRAAQWDPTASIGQIGQGLNNISPKKKTPSMPWQVADAGHSVWGANL